MAEDKRIVYADNAATTRVSEGVMLEMMPYFRENFGNPASLHDAGRRARAALEDARTRVARTLGTDPCEIAFTSGGSEGDTAAMLGSAREIRRANPARCRIIVSEIEHAAVLCAAERLGCEGFYVTYLRPDKSGIIRPSELERAVGADVALVSVMTANNEVGTIQPIRRLADIAHEHGAIFFTDAVQAPCATRLDVRELGVDLLCVSGHKIRAPKGSGALFVRRGTPFQSLICGEGEGRELRPGTENVAFAAGLARALEDAAKLDRASIAKVRDLLLDRLLRIPGTALNGDRELRVPSNINIFIENTDADGLVLLLERCGVYVSSGAACSSGNGKPSHVLLAMGFDEARARGSLRITISDETTLRDAEYIADAVSSCVKAQRSLGL